MDYQRLAQKDTASNMPRKQCFSPPQKKPVNTAQPVLVPIHDLTQQQVDAVPMPCSTDSCVIIPLVHQHPNSPPTYDTTFPPSLAQQGVNEDHFRAFVKQATRLAQSRWRASNPHPLTVALSLIPTPPLTLLLFLCVVASRFLRGGLSLPVAAAAFTTFIVLRLVSSRLAQARVEGACQSLCGLALHADLANAALEEQGLRWAIAEDGRWLELHVARCVEAEVLVASQMKDACLGGRDDSDSSDTDKEEEDSHVSQQQATHSTRKGFSFPHPDKQFEQRTNKQHFRTDWSWNYGPPLQSTRQDQRVRIAHLISV